MRSLEEVVIMTLNHYNITAERKDGMTGVWVDDEKICAMGVRVSRWVTMHGFALNLTPKMEYYDSMIPCGIFHYGITTLNQQGIDITIENYYIFLNIKFKLLILHYYSIQNDIL